MPRSSRLLRFSTALALLGALGLGACKKSGDSAGPLATGSDPQARTTSGGVVLRYKPGPTKIKEDLKVSFTASGGGQGGEMKADITGLLDINDAGPDKLKVGFSILDVRQFELTGGMKPTPKDGKPAPDLFLHAASGLRRPVLGRRCWSVSAWWCSWWFLSGCWCGW